MIYDGIIVGAGPAGAHLAYLLANAGLHIALIDRRTFPRDKLCGGLLTQKTIKLLSASYRNLEYPKFPINAAHVFFKDELAASLNILSPAYTVRRFDFDAQLLKTAVAQGAHPYLGSSLVHVDFTRQEVYLKNGHMLRYTHLIGADGALSTVRHQAGIAKGRLGFCMETHIPWAKVKNANRIKMHSIEIYYGSFSTGYGWIFPTESSVAIGVGNLTDEMSEKKILQLYQLFLNTVTRDAVIQSSGAYLPAGDSIALGTYKYDNFCLIGDAAGLIDPFTGEGLYYALLSAELVAQAILSGKPVYPQYVTNMYQIQKALHDNVQIRNKLYIPTIMESAISSLQSLPEYCEKLIDDTIVTYTKSYTAAYKEFQFYSR